MLSALALPAVNQYTSRITSSVVNDSGCLSVVMNEVRMIPCPLVEWFLTSVVRNDVPRLAGCFDSA